MNGVLSKDSKKSQKSFKNTQREKAPKDGHLGGW